jgi:hypothetical protein
MRKVGLWDEKKDTAVWCDSSYGPYFSEIRISDHCNANTSSYSYLAECCANDTGLSPRTVLTGSYHFTVKKIEVFEIID